MDKPIALTIHLIVDVFFLDYREPQNWVSSETKCYRQTLWCIHTCLSNNGKKTIQASNNKDFISEWISEVGSRNGDGCVWQITGNF